MILLRLTQSSVGVDRYRIEVALEGDGFSRLTATSEFNIGAQIGFFAVLHSWGQNLLFHPHLHCLIPAGGLSPDHTRWIHPRYHFFLRWVYSVGSFAASSSMLSNDDFNNAN
ncbi:MAG TPA: transposase [Candidatus Eisenbacteria bacterium]|nr:transposase [Candidatus Eisenbacteria bacterium]